jgi:hypothetical protein
LIQDKRTGQIVGQGHEFGGLFRLASPTIYCIAETASIIHQRLGHPNLQKLHCMIPSLAKVQSIPCESCQLGKHVRSTYPNRVNKRAIRIDI